MPGFAPKAPEVRRTHHPPQRGEWVDLPREGSVPPAGLPRRAKGTGAWSEATRRAWGIWWADPVSAQWGRADVELLEHLARLMEEFVREPKAAWASEMRQTKDLLGLTPKGRQDRRWRYQESGEVVELERKPARDRMKELKARAASTSRSA